MGIAPVYYLADIQSGALYGTKLPLESVSLDSSLAPGQFSASLDLRQYGNYEGRTREQAMEDGREIVALLKYGKCTLVPVLEGLSNGATKPPTSRALGEWWISDVQGTQQSPIITIAGPEFVGYLSELLVVDDFIGTYDPVALTRSLLSLAFTFSQNIAVDLQSWVSDTGARVSTDLREVTQDYWSAIATLQDNPTGPFEWLIRAGLQLNGWSPEKVTRTLEVGQPKFNLARPGVTLSVKAPGEYPASILDRAWSFSESRSATNINGLGAGSGHDQIGPVHEARTRQPGEPGKSRLIVDQSAMNSDQLRRSVRRALRQNTPAEQSFSASLQSDAYTPRVGEVYSWRQAASWALPAVSGEARVNGWAWSSSNPEVFDLALTEV